MAKGKSRPQRWAEAVRDAKAAVEAARSAVTDIESELSVLDEIKSEYQEWRDSLPENTEGGVVAEKLDAVLELEFESESLGDELDRIEGVLEEAEAVDLPRGFGKD